MGPNGIKDDTIYWRLHCGPLFMESTYCGKRHPVLSRLIRLGNHKIMMGARSIVDIVVSQNKGTPI